MKRIATAVVLIPIVVWIVLAAPQAAFQALLVIVGLLAFHEFDTIAAANGIERSGYLGMAAGLVLLFVPEPALPMVVVLAIVLMSWMLRARDLAKAMAGSGVALLGIVYIFGAWRAATAIREVDPNWLMIALLVSWAGDTAALYVGRSMGRRKLAPRVSPNKTWEGTIASVAGAMLAAVIYGIFLIPYASWLQVAAIAGVANIAGQLGDLCESAFKRGGNMKDSGTTLPGHGGWLDRIDSTLFSVPVTYVLLRWML